MTLQDYRESNYETSSTALAILQYTHEHTVRNNRGHMEVLQQNATKFWLGTIIEDIKVHVQVQISSYE
jgi:hypothetical protein